VRKRSGLIGRQADIGSRDKLWHPVMGHVAMEAHRYVRLPSLCFVLWPRGTAADQMQLQPWLPDLGQGLQQRTQIVVGVHDSHIQQYASIATDAEGLSRQQLVQRAE
jgi:hypothetical protein